MIRILGKACFPDQPSSRQRANILTAFWTIGIGFLMGGFIAAFLYLLLHTSR